MNLFLYRIGTFSFFLIIRILSWFGHTKAIQMTEGRKNLLQKISEAVKGQKNIVWVHCASLGEFEQGRPLIEEIKKRFPYKKIFLTFFSPSGYLIRKNYNLADWVFYLPYDTPSNAKKFYDLIKPEKVFFVKYEFWYYHLNQLKINKIPTYLVSGIFRTNHIFFQKRGLWYRQILHSFSHLFLQDELSAQLLKNIGINNCTVTGDTRFDRVATIASESKELPIIQQFTNNRKVLIAGSTWTPDELILHEYFAKNKDKLSLIIAPHEIHTSHLESIEKLFGNELIRYSQSEVKDLTKYKVMLIDNMGMLSSIYKYGQIGYIGGGFGVGIHNTLEPAVYGIPVIFGGKYQKFNEAVELIKRGGGFTINNANDFEILMDKLLADENYRKESGHQAGAFVLSGKGATHKIVNDCFNTQQV